MDRESHIGIQYLPVSSQLSCWLHERESTPGDYLFLVAHTGCQRRSDRCLLILDRLAYWSREIDFPGQQRYIGKAGDPARYNGQPSVGFYDEAAITPRSGPSPTRNLETEHIRSSAVRRKPEIRRQPNADRQENSEEGAVDASITPRPSTTADTASERMLPHRDPPIFASVRQVLSCNPPFASAVVSAIKRLPPSNRAILIGHNEIDATDCADGSSPDPSRSCERDAKRLKVSDDNPKHGDEGCPGNNKNLKGNDKDGEGGNDGDEGNGGDGPPSSSNKGGSQKKKGRWICPYHLAYPELYWIPHFKDCSPGNMVDPNEWRTHLGRHHSPEAKGKHLKKNKGLDADRIEKFYMAQETLDTVLQEIKSHSERPRGNHRDKYRTDLFIKVWCMIFPKDKFPHFKEPLSAFHCAGEDVGEHLTHQAGILLGTLYDAKADEALKSGALPILPTAAETREFMSQAIAIALLNSPIATGPTQWLARARPEEVEAAGQNYMDRSVPSLMTIFSSDEDLTPNDKGLVTHPTTYNTSHPAPSAGRLWPVQLFPNGTWLELLPSNSNHRQEAYLSLPPEWYLANTRPIPSMRAPVMHSPFYTDLPPTTPSQQGNWAPPIEPAREGVSLQAIQRGPIAPEEFNFDIDYLNR
ncbi:uncharacterized protein B0J16DRAFT_331762 [Fusarium flagelliforme]|uniref:uncharacterized protein n=1 Tax=Fusarium flagelliforme TaxID=2675880 RepID=UPI001E8DCAE6|nr:uncharacterized protein B0J16DRAFT_331762 [Fusarium flagelliforme]KAH7191781.1 hypothetical protein B0J16DRAFT_331762 [Fusarium flagelliforme]